MLRQDHKGRNPKRRNAGASNWPNVSGLKNSEAAEAYAKYGIPVVPVPPGTKHPGGYLGQGWPKLATCDLDTIRDWWRRWPDAGIATHVGGGQLLVLDVDKPENVPDWLWPLLESAVFLPTTSEPDTGRGHYVYRQRPGDRFGNGLGKLKQPKGKAWGEIRGYGGGLVLAPTVHPRADEGGAYTAVKDQPIPYVPEQIAEKLNAVAEDAERELLTPAELDAKVKVFLADYADDREPYALRPILAAFDATPGGRHDSMWEAVCWGLREAKAGRFAARTVVDELQARWDAAFDGDGRAPDADEFNRMVRDGVAVADTSDVGALQRRNGRFVNAKAAELARKVLEPGGRWHHDTLWARLEAIEPEPKQPATDADEPPSWIPVDIASARRGVGATPPTVLTRSDGACLFYRGKTHSVHGESESGKSWLMQCATAECLLAGEPVLYVDFEDEGGAVAERLIRLGVPAGGGRWGYRLDGRVWLVDKGQ
jgi:hypothetical protein